MADPPKSAYEVGYKKPPVARRFQKGRSGNPKGRPRGSVNRVALTFGEERLKALLLEEAYRTIPIQEAGKSISMPMVQAVIRSVAVSAAKGQSRAQRLFLEMIRTIEDEHYQAHMSYLQTVIDYKAGWEEVIAAATKNGLPIPSPLPHPKDIEINFRTGEIKIEGPLTETERNNWERLRAMKDEVKQEISLCEADLADPDCQYREQIQQDLDHSHKMLGIISKVIKD